MADRDGGVTDKGHKEQLQGSSGISAGEMVYMLNVFKPAQQADAELHKRGGAEGRSASRLLVDVFG